MAPTENHHVCTACGQSYPVTALVCKCGGREFVPVELETGGASMSVRTEWRDSSGWSGTARERHARGKR